MDTIDSKGLVPFRPDSCLIAYTYLSGAPLFSTNTVKTSIL